jgi:predicted ATPase
MLTSGVVALNGDFVRIGTFQDALFWGAKEVKIGFQLGLGGALSAKLAFEYEPEDLSVIDYKQNEVLDGICKVDEASSLDEMTSLESLFIDNCQYLGAERVGPQTSFAMSNVVRRHRQLGPHGEFTAHFLTVFGSEPLSNPVVVHPDAAPTLSSQVEYWIAKISPGTRLNLETFQRMDLVGLQYSTKAGTLLGEPVRPTNFGFGVTYVLPVLTAILGARPGSLLLIENPEAHLHPRGQVAMGELMALAAAGGVQIITETHSDHVLNGVRIAVHRGVVAPKAVRLHYFQRDSNAADARTHVVSPRIDRDGRIDQWPEGFFDEWTNSLDQLLFPAVANVS